MDTCRNDNVHVKSQRAPAVRERRGLTNATRPFADTISVRNPPCACARRVASSPYGAASKATRVRRNRPCSCPQRMRFDRQASLVDVGDSAAAMLVRAGWKSRRADLSRRRRRARGTRPRSVPKCVWGGGCARCVAHARRDEIVGCTYKSHNAGLPVHVYLYIVCPTNP